MGTRGNRRDKRSRGERWRCRWEQRREWHQQFRRSLRGRLIALFLLLALGTSLVFFGGSKAVFSTGWRVLVQPLVKDYIDRLAAEVGSPPDIARAQALAQRLPIAVHIDGPEVHWSSHPQRLTGHDFPMKDFLSRRTADGHTVRFGLGDWRVDDRPRFVVWATLAAMLLLLAAAFAYVRHLFRPLDDIRAGALRYGGGDFSQPIPLRRRDELGDLAQHVNGMAEGLQRLLEGQRGLLLAISHELRSPLTRARLNAELVAEGDSRDALLRDLALMRDLIANLLESERLAGGQAAALQRTPGDVHALLHGVLASPEFAGQPVQLDLAPALPDFSFDRARLQMLLRNLLDNALRHNQESERPVIVSTHRDGDWLVLTVRDHGPGVADADLARLAQPFYRPDAARTRAGGGVGLGLYLCRLVAQSHGGTLTFALADPGLRVQLRLPLVEFSPA